LSDDADRRAPREGLADRLPHLVALFPENAESQ
jgi:hypothetical protein